MSDELKNPKTLPETALMSELSLAKDWFKPEEDEAWDYLSG